MNILRSRCDFDRSRSSEAILRVAVLGLGCSRSLGAFWAERKGCKSHWAESSDIKNGKYEDEKEGAKKMTYKTETDAASEGYVLRRRSHGSVCEEECHGKASADDLCGTLIG